MGSKARKHDDLLKDLDELGIETSSEKPSTSATGTTANNNGDDEDLFGDIEKQLATRPAAAAAAAGTGGSRPSTPRMSSSTTSGTTTKSRAAADHTPTSSGAPSARTSEDRLRAADKEKRVSGERSYHQASTPGLAAGPSTPDAKTESGAGGGWWGSMFSVASAAVKQAETLAKEIRANEEAMKWADQVRGYGANLQHLSTDLRERALPTFTSLISHIAPPISAHERLQIHITHDIQEYPSLDPLIYETFSRVMAQVEGGDLLVIQRGSESRSRARASSELHGYRGAVLGSSSRWTDGPWWRDDTSKRELGAVPGLKEGTRLARVSAESYAKDFFDARGGLEAAAQKATETLSESNPVRSSDIFLAIQPISYTADTTLFADAATTQQPAGGVIEPEEGPEELVAFAVYLYDPMHSLAFGTLGQPIPQKWAAWLDASAEGGNDGDEPALPESILEIVQAGGVDPREWVAEWMEEVLGLAVGVVAQRYVARRMGVGEGGLGRGKMRAEEAGIGGEAARAI